MTALISKLKTDFETPYNAKEHLVSLAHYSEDELWHFIKLGKQLKDDVKSGKPSSMFAGKTLAMIFQKPSLRTRVSFEVGMTQLGGHAIYLGPDDIKLGQRETVEDIAKVVSSYANGIMARVFGHDIIEELATYANVPVINGLSDLLHPCQGLGDFLTIYENKPNLEGLKLTFIGDGNNVAHSLLNAGSQLGLDITIACPEGYEPNADIMAFAKSFGTQIEIEHDPVAAVQNADVVYTDVWASMGQEAEAEAKNKLFQPFQVNAQLLSHAKNDCIVMHCLPAHYDEEITHDVAHGPNSVVFPQAENRLHAQKAVMVSLMK
jgi:ornithine carbamoyltransferase